MHWAYATACASGVAPDEPDAPAEAAVVVVVGCEPAVALVGD
jgi:hypothetical protein